jgi:serine/threonine protein kinase
MTEDPSTPDSQAPRTNDTSSADHLAAAAAKASALPDQLTQLRQRVQEQLPDFELGDCIGRGGAGAVFKARQHKLDRQVAIKILLPPPGDCAGWSERFEREAKALARLQHPGIVTIYDFGQLDDLAWLVMEFLDGATLRALMADGHLTPSEALTIVPPLCDALQYAHDRGIVHRDIKPENVLVDIQGNVKLVDFGLAKLAATDGAANLTRSDQAMGTPRYMAPEQLDRPLEVDHRADIFSLGIVFYEMLTGQIPAGVVEPPSSKIAIDVRLDQVVLRALQRDPEKRYQSAVEFKTEIHQAKTNDDDAASLHPEQKRPNDDAAATGQAKPHIGTRDDAGLTLSDLAAMSALPIGLLLAFLVYANREGDQRDQSIDGTQHGIFVFAVCATWWLIPLASSIHWFKVRYRGRTVAVSMPLLRTVLAATLTGGCFAALHGMWPSYHKLYTHEAKMILLVGALTASLGAWSQRGTHRCLMGPKVAKQMLTTIGFLTFIPAMIGGTWVINGVTGFSARSEFFCASLPILVHIPGLLGACLAVLLYQAGNLRGALLAMTIGVLLTLLVHVFAGVSYSGGLDIPMWGCLLLAAVIGLGTVAGTAEPTPQAAKF